MFVESNGNKIVIDYAKKCTCVYTNKQKGKVVHVCKILFFSSSVVSHFYDKLLDKMFTKLYIEAVIKIFLFQFYYFRSMYAHQMLHTYTYTQ